MKRPPLRHLLLPIFGGLFLTSSLDAQLSRPFGIRIVDEKTGRGVPLMELRTVNDIRCVTDNAGWAAFYEPGLMDREVFFWLSGPGYDMEKDGFGFKGVRPTPRSGGTATYKVKNTNIAERIGRTTGQGIYRDSELLGLPCPVPNLMAEVMGQDSVQAVPYRGKIFWLFGDTNNPQYPLGNYQTTCATSPPGADPERGLVLDYFMDPQKPGRLRHMMPHPEHGAIWLFGLLTVRDDKGGEALVAHYGRHTGLSDPLDHGVCRFNDARGVFEKVVELDANEKWRFPRGNAVRVKNDEGDWFYFAHPFCHTRVKGALGDLTSPASFEALRFDEESRAWRWQRDAPATTQGEELKLMLSGKMKAEQARHHLKDAATGKAVSLHAASIEWNAWRRRWVLIGLQNGGKDDPSPLGEVWYAESSAPDGPWRKAVKVASHPRYSFYNPVHHAFLDGEGGRIIYFQGTYSLEFSGNPIAPARYDYNQLMYRLDLSDGRLQGAH
ncbi:MAG: hypothetical protein K1X78_09360 [Verrucomicrobiaceae bacterium]|nr:hypothetical protein [Verrucomicrobiaceae bacterium]